MHIGLFDSGVGGLTVLRELIQEIPEARYTYLGDTARLPYGNKAPETLQKYTAENIHFLEQQGVDCIVIACHSASSVSLDLALSPNGTLVLNVITPSCIQARQQSKNKKIAIMATKATTKSQVYSQSLKNLETSLEVLSQECPLLVPLVEEQLIEDEVTDFILKRYLLPIHQFGADTVILGCTHYPILKNQIQGILGANIQLIDPAYAVAQEIKKITEAETTTKPIEIYLTDHSPHFIEHAQGLLGDLKNVAFLMPDS